MAISNEEKLRRLFSLLDEDGLTNETFAKQFKMVVDFVKKIEAKNIKAIDDLGTMHSKLSNKINGDSTNNIANIKQDFKVQLDGLKAKYKKVIELLNVRVADIKDGVNGLDADDEAIYKRLKKRIPKTEEIAKSIPLVSEEIRNALENLSGDKRLMVSAVDGLEEKLKELESRPLGGKGGGGFSKIHMEMKFIDDEDLTVLTTPDGIGKDFSLNNAPNPVASLKVDLGSGRVHLTDDYTFSDRTISFLIAPPTGAVIRASYRV